MSSEESDLNKDNKRKRTESNSSAEAGLPPWVTAASPQRFFSLEELMNMADNLDKMALAHEIAVNSDFKFEPSQLAEGSLARRVHDIVHQAFWDVLREELARTPPEFEHALVLLTEIKDTLLSLLLPHHTKLRSEIEERLDLELIRQQCEKECIDFLPIASYILSVMKKLCAPVRDPSIDALTACTDVVDLYKGIFEILDLMKVDMANFTIAAMRPTIQQHSVEYEREQFAKLLESNPNGLDSTERWIRQALADVRHQREESERYSEDVKRHAASATSPAESPHSELPSSSQVTLSTATLHEVLSAAYWSLLDINNNELKPEDFPETLSVDRDRISQMRKTYRQLIGVASVIALACSAAGKEVADLREFKEQLKDKLEAVLAESDSPERFAELLAGVAELVPGEINEALYKLDLPEWDSSRKEALKKQIIQLAETDQPVRKLIGDRVKTFVVNVITNPSASPIKVPPGLSVVQKELARLAGAFLHVVSHNRSVFTPHYESLLEKILSSDSTC